jgi:alanine racemase
MNIIMADITGIPNVNTEDEAVLIGRCGDKEITAEDFASWAGTINYEVTTRINDRIPRIIRE